MESPATMSMRSWTGWEKLKEDGFRMVDDWEVEDSRESKGEVRSEGSCFIGECSGRQEG